MPDWVSESASGSLCIQQWSKIRTGSNVKIHQRLELLLSKNYQQLQLQEREDCGLGHLGFGLQLSDAR